MYIKFSSNIEHCSKNKNKKKSKLYENWYFLLNDDYKKCFDN